MHKWSQRRGGGGSVLNPPPPELQRKIDNKNTKKCNETKEKQDVFYFLFLCVNTFKTRMYLKKHLNRHPPPEKNSGSAPMKYQLQLYSKKE